MHALLSSPLLSLPAAAGRRALGAAALTLLAAGSIAGLAEAQGDPNDTERVIHLWVDPRYGDDDLALGTDPARADALNPDGTTPTNTGPFGGCQPSGLRPNDVRDPSQQGLPLLHAAYPFRTITAAVSYINAIGSPPLPYTSATSPPICWQYAIIHLLPGLYGAEPPAGQDPNHPDNGLVPNGETFPILLPPRVSIQGTSALNTLFDLGLQHTAFRFGVLDANNVPITGEGTFISTVTFYRGGVLSPDPGRATDAAAILIDDQLPAAPTIANCFFVRNVIGVLVNTPASGNNNTDEPAVRHDGLSLVNNTFAWNLIGVWNGQDANNGGVSIGYGWSRLNVINNILDAGIPQVAGAGQYCDGTLAWPNNPATWSTNAGPNTFFVHSAFEGVADVDLRVQVSSSPPAFADSNAYEFVTPTLKNYNSGTLTVTGLPPVSVRPTTLDPVPAAALNIAPITGFGQGPGGVLLPRGILYVRDLFCNGRSFGNNEFQNNNPSFDGSPLDFRLCPSVANADPNFPSPTLDNPLIDNGFNGPFPVTMANGNVIQHRPGTLPLRPESQHRWPWDNWRFDCEGHGNPRAVDFPPLGLGGPCCVGSPPIDIGADEAATLIVAGYRFGTTTFMQLDSSHPAVPQDLGTGPIDFDNRYQYYLGPASTTPLGTPVSQPKFREYVFQQPPAAPPSWALNYLADSNTPAVVWHSDEHTPLTSFEARPWRFDVVGSVLVPCNPTVPCNDPTVPRSCPCGAEFARMYRATPADITPHLLPDAHPWWTRLVPTANFIPPALTTWQPCLGTGLYNEDLYETPTEPVINPPGAYDGVPGVFTWLDGLPLFGTTPSFLPFNVWQWNNVPAQEERVVDFDAWCRGGDPGLAASSREHALPDTTLLAGSFPDRVADPAVLRYSVEWESEPFASPDKNLQSFAVQIHEELK